MKNGRSYRRHSRHRNPTPGVICLPAQKPPIAAPRKEPEVARALPLPDQPEALVAANDQDNFQSRQLRRQARRAEAKATRRTMSPMPRHDPVVVEAVEPAMVERPVQREETLTPLPRDRALALPTHAIMARIGAWLRSLVMKQPAARSRMSQESAVAHLRAMRAEVAQMQRTLDWMLDGAPEQSAQVRSRG